MISIRIKNDKQSKQFENRGVLEFGRAPERGTPRCQLDDIYVSRDHLRIEELPDGRINLENLSTSRPVYLANGVNVPESGKIVLELPIHLTIGKTKIDLEPEGTPPDTRLPPALKTSSYSTNLLEQAVQIKAAEEHEPFEEKRFQALSDTSAIQLPKKNSAGTSHDNLAEWLETVIALQRAAPGSPEFYRQTGEALVELIGLDLGLVLLKRQERWLVAGAAVVDDRVNVRYSRTLLDHVATTRATVYQDINAWKEDSISLADVDAVVAAPIIGLNDDVVGVLYGMRANQIIERGGVQSLEAQLVQLLASTVGVYLARSAAQRTRVQFEQFFSPELARELERNPDMLEGRNQEVTVLFSDLRGFTVLSQRLGAEKTCRLVRDVMEQLSERIVQHGGVIVDYAGDGILAMWNAPSPQADHAARACHAALDMHGEIPGLNQKWQEWAEGKLALGIGLNTGMAQVGNTGSSRKFKYGPHGHAVNLASRVQDATKKLGLPVLMTESTRCLLPADLASRRLGQVRLPGVKEAVVLYELKGKQPHPGWETWRNTYEQALTEYESGQWAKACQTLLPLLQNFEKAEQLDGPILKLLRRAGECLESRPDPFDPVIEVTTK